MDNAVQVWHLLASVGTVVVGALVFIWRAGSKMAILQNDVEHLKKANSKRKTEIKNLEKDIRTSLEDISKIISEIYTSVKLLEQRNKLNVTNETKS